MNGERLDRCDAVELFVRQQFPMIPIDARYAVTLGDFSAQTLAQFRNSRHLTIGNGEIVAEMGALSHSSDTDETQTYFRHVRPPFPPPADMRQRLCTFIRDF